MDCDERRAGGHERARICAGNAREVLPQGHDGEEADDADGDEGAFNEPSGDIAERERFVLPLEDGERRDGGATLAMMRRTSRNAPRATPVSAPAPATLLASSSTGVYSRSAAGIAVTKVMMKSAPVTRAVLLLESIGTPFAPVGRVGTVIAVPVSFLACGAVDLVDPEQRQVEVAQGAEQPVQGRLVDDGPSMRVVPSARVVRVIPSNRAAQRG
jgi:hypothetical protein